MSGKRRPGTQPKPRTPGENLADIFVGAYEPSSEEDEDKQNNTPPRRSKRYDKKPSPPKSGKKSGFDALGLPEIASEISRYMDGVDIRATPTVRKKRMDPYFNQLVKRLNVDAAPILHTNEGFYMVTNFVTPGSKEERNKWMRRVGEPERMPPKVDVLFFVYREQNPTDTLDNMRDRFKDFLSRIKKQLDLKPFLSGRRKLFAYDGPSSLYGNFDQTFTPNCHNSIQGTESLLPDTEDHGATDLMRGIVRQFRSSATTLYDDADAFFDTQQTEHFTYCCNITLWDQIVWRPTMGHIKALPLKDMIVFKGQAIHLLSREMHELSSQMIAEAKNWKKKYPIPPSASEHQRVQLRNAYTGALEAAEQAAVDVMTITCGRIWTVCASCVAIGKPVPRFIWHTTREYLEQDYHMLLDTLEYARELEKQNQERRAVYGVDIPCYLSQETTGCVQFVVHASDSAQDYQKCFSPQTAWFFLSENLDQIPSLGDPSEIMIRADKAGVNPKGSNVRQ